MRIANLELRMYFTDDLGKEMVFISMEVIKLRIANLELRTYFTYDLGKEMVIHWFAISKHHGHPFAIRN